MTRHFWSTLAAACALASAFAGCGEEPIAAPTKAAVDATDAGMDSGPDQAVAADVPVVDAPSPGTACKLDLDCPAATSACTLARCDVVTHLCDTVRSDNGVACEDGDSCTANDQCNAGQCVPGLAVCNCKTAADCAGLDDGDACNGTWICDTTAAPAKCMTNPASVVKCPPNLDNPCVANVCQKATGACLAMPTNDGGACEDGYLCTVGDACSSGKCGPGPSTCACQKNADCSDDGNLCNGMPYCDKSVAPFTCQINPSTVVICAKSQDTACTSATCNPASGQCALLSAADTATCDDGNACTANDHCQAGQCAGGEDLCGCKTDADCGKFEDGDLCNGKLFCNVKVFPHMCQTNPASVVTCPSVLDTTCRKNLCQPNSGVCAQVSVAEKQVCDDDNPCTPDEACQSGACTATTNICPCSNSSACAAKDDGNLCNGTLFCDKSKLPYVCSVNPATVVSCPSASDSACLQNKCQVATGTCAYTKALDGLDCDDGNVCTSGDACKSGACFSGPGACACEKDGDCPGDGNACNGKLFCNKASNTCQLNPGSVVVCPSAQDTVCTANTCQPASGQCALQAVHEGLTCDADGNPCTVGDVCGKGACVAGPNTCSCQADGDCGQFEDGNVCNGKLYCNKTKVPYVCAVNPATVVNCPASNVGPCKVNACNPQNGQCGAAAVADDTGCEDGKLCTVGDVCAAGSCVPGTNICGCQSDVECAGQEDGNWCNGTLFCDKSAIPFLCKVNPGTIKLCGAVGDSTCMKSLCVPASGLCAPQPVSAGGACDDGDVCTVADVCVQGQCTGAPKLCNDGDVCSVDDCDPQDGCVTVPELVNACSDGDACTADACDGKKGCSHAAISVGPCDDGDVCTATDTCTKGVCSGTGNGCDDGNPCTDDACTSTGKACTHAANTAGCGVGLSCLNGTCGGCLAFRRVHRYGCDELLPTTKPGGATPCEQAANAEREEFEDVATLSDGRIAAVGATTTTGTNQTQGLVTVFAADGKVVWEKALGTLGSDRLLGVAATADGGLWAAGGTSDSGTPQPWLARLAADGTQLVSVLVPPPGNAAAAVSRLESVTALADGGAVAVGARDAQTSGATSSDALVVRVDGQGKVVWQKLLGVVSAGQPPSVERLWAVRLTPDGTGVVAVGDRVQPKLPQHQQDGWVVRLDLAGNLLWQATPGGSGLDALYGLAFGDAGEIVAVGSTGKATASAAGDGWLLRLDAAGQVLAQMAVPGGGDDVLQAVVRTVHGAWLAAGRMTVDHKGDASWSAGWDPQHAWLVRWDAKWQPAWDKRYDALGLDRLAGLSALANGDVAAVGDTRVDAASKPDAFLLRVGAQGNDLCPCHFYSEKLLTTGTSALHGVVRLDNDSAVAVGLTTDASGSTDGWLVAYDADGEVIWQKTAGGPGADELRDVVRDGQGGLLAVGETQSGLGGTDGWVVRLGENGKITTQLTVGGSDEDHLESVTALPGAAPGSVLGFLASGWTRSGSAGKWDGWLVRLDATGKVLWNKPIGSANDDRFWGATVLAGGKILAAGDSRNAPAPFDQYHMWTVQLDGDGKVLTQEYLAPGYADGLRNVVRLADGGAVAVGTASGAKVLRFDAEGKSVGASVQGGATYFDDVVALADGGWIGIGHEEYLPLAVRFDVAGKVLWSSTVNWTGIGVWGDQGSLQAGALLADGTLALVGQFIGKNNGANLGLRLRMHSRWGHYLNHSACNFTPPCDRGGCDRWSGCVVTHEVAPCTDGNFCTKADQCNDGKCTDTQVVVCDDGNPCTSDACVFGQGCYVSPITTQPGAVCGPDKTCGPTGSCGTCATDTFVLGGPAAGEAISDAVMQGDGTIVGVGRLRKGNWPPSNDEGWIAHIGVNDQLGQQSLVTTTVQDNLEALLPAGDGGLFTVGWSQPDAYDTDSLAARVGKDGKVVWQKSVTGPGTVAWYGVAPELVGGKVVAVGTNKGQAWLAGLDAATGDTAWEVKLPSLNNGDVLRGAALTPAGDIVAAGMKYSNVSADGYLVRLAADHTVAWQILVGENDRAEQFNQVRIAPNGNITAIGWRMADNAEWWIVRLDAAGKILWQYKPVLGDLQQLFDGVLVGEDVLAVGIAGKMYNHYMGAILRIDGSGQQVWLKTLTEINISRLEAIVPGPAGLFTALGMAEMSGGDQAWVVRFDADGKVFCGQ